VFGSKKINEVAHSSFVASGECPIFEANAVRLGAVVPKFCLAATPSPPDPHKSRGGPMRRHCWSLGLILTLRTLPAEFVTAQKNSTTDAALKAPQPN